MTVQEMKLGTNIPYEHMGENPQQCLVKWYLEPCKRKAAYYEQDRVALEWKVSIGQPMKKGMQHTMLIK